MARNGCSVRVFTVEVFGKVRFGHVVVDFATLVSWDVRSGVVPFVHELLEQRVDFALHGLAVQSALHLVFLLCLSLSVLGVLFTRFL